MSKKSDNPMRYKVYIDSELSGVSCVRFFRKEESARKYYESLQEKVKSSVRACSYYVHLLDLQEETGEGTHYLPSITESVEDTHCHCCCSNSCCESNLSEDFENKNDSYDSSKDTAFNKVVNFIRKRFKVIK